MRVCPATRRRLSPAAAGGLPLLVSPLPDWQEMFMAPGYGVTCGVENVDSVEAALRWYLEDPRDARRWVNAAGSASSPNGTTKGSSRRCAV